MSQIVTFMLGINHLVACGFYGLTEITQASEDGFRAQRLWKNVRIKGSLTCDPHVIWTLLFRVPAVLSFVYILAFTRQGHVCLCVCVYR